MRNGWTISNQSTLKQANGPPNHSLGLLTHFGQWALVWQAPIRSLPYQAEDQGGRVGPHYGTSVVRMTSRNMVVKVNGRRSPALLICPVRSFDATAIVYTNMVSFFVIYGSKTTRY